jgi:hypothetical protein
MCLEDALSGFKLLRQQRGRWLSLSRDTARETCGQGGGRRPGHDGRAVRRHELPGSFSGIQAKPQLNHGSSLQNEFVHQTRTQSPPACLAPWEARGFPAQAHLSLGRSNPPVDGSLL